MDTDARRVAEAETPPGEGPASLWFGMLAGPVSFLVSLQVMFTLEPWACAKGWRLGLYLFPLSMVALSAAAALVAWRNWRLVGREWPGGEGGPQPRSRFMAATGVLVSALMLLTVVAHWLPTLFISPCQRG
ncbi:MAG: uncharacterized protein JWM27_255 [Gemmatimonadetes bacterium]|nr:uncharacterized protein [Gemmatimonadota bacterium]